jgi:uncharacterized protein YkwD
MHPFPAARDLACATAVLLAALLIALSAANRAEAATPCSDSAAATQRTLCLVNAERRAHALPPLVASNRLRRAAARHGRDMVARRYFAHVSPGGGDVRRRVARTGYLRDSSAWMLGENIAWGAGERATPRAIVAAWMASPGHRANILRRSFREIGIAVVAGAPLASFDDAATYVTDFGTR